MNVQTLQSNHEELTGTIEPGFFLWVAELVRSYRQRLIHYACRQGLDREEALDCVQEAFVSFLGAPAARGLQQEREDSLKLLTVMLRNIVSNRSRSIRRRTQRLDYGEPDTNATAEASSEALIVEAENAARLGMCIKRLNELQQAVVRLMLLEGATGDETAAALNLNPGHVRVLLHRAREHMKTCSSYHQPDETETHAGKASIT